MFVQRTGIRSFLFTSPSHASVESSNGFYHCRKKWFCFFFFLLLTFLLWGGQSAATGTTAPLEVIIPQRSAEQMMQTRAVNTPLQRTEVPADTWIVL